MTKFRQAHAFVAKWEGGFVMDPDDPGGATNYGISLRFLEGLPLDVCDVNKDGKLTWHDVKAMSREQAEGLYRAYFWDKLYLDALPLPLGTVIYDTAVNCGSRRAATWLQEQLPGVAVDGMIGPKTSYAVLRVIEVTPRAETFNLMNGVYVRRERHYRELPKSNPKLVKYLKGWLNRLEDLRGFAKELLRQTYPMIAPTQIFSPTVGEAVLLAKELSEVLGEVRAAGMLPEHLMPRAVLLMERARGM